jgi:transcriptional regulator with XRE-family HTH domain
LFYVVEDIQIKFGRAIQKLRKDRGWSQEKLAELSAFHRTYIGMIERGERNPSLKNIEKFSKVFSISLCELFAIIQEE